MTEDLEWSQPVDDPTRPERTPRGCRRHQWVTTRWQVLGEIAEREQVACGRCGKVRDWTTVRRGKNNRNRGNAIEREVGKRLGLRRVGQYGGPEDLAGEMFAAQVKSGGAFSERFWQWLKAVPTGADQTALLVVTDAPGPGVKRRAVVILELDDWIALHGKDGVA